MGLGQYDFRRIKAFLLHTLYERGESGKSLYYSELMKSLYDTLGFIPEEVVNATAKSMMDNKDVVVLDDGNKIALKRYYTLEENITKELIRLKNGVVNNETIDETTVEEDEWGEIKLNNYKPKSFDISDWKNIIKQVEEEQGYEFTEEQYAALEISLYNYVMALTGGAGAGKTSTANGICRLYNNYEILAVALSGKASVRITEATGLPASTIHRGLDYQCGEFQYNKYNQLPVDIVLVDEATMINGTLFLALLEAIPTGAKSNCYGRCTTAYS